MSSEQQTWQYESVVIGLDRDADTRESVELMAGLWASQHARLVRVGPHGQVDATSEAPDGDFDPSLHVYLGRGGSRAWFATASDAPQGRVLRDGGFSSLDEELAAAAVAIVSWHRRSPRCERCGGQTGPAHGGFVRVCEDCGQQLFPRSDPAMIVVLLDPGETPEQERLLLAHQVTWPAGRMSLLAGFVEAGESVEAAVVREVQEEARLRVRSLRYLASQAWPFPRSLMLGYVATCDPGVPVVDTVELDQARWFTRDELAEAERSGEVLLSAPGSIARRMIEAWRAGLITAATADQVVQAPV